MNGKQIYETKGWRQFRDEIWERDKGRCHLCRRDGFDVHYTTMRWGLFEPRAIFVVCRYCNEVWYGFPPDHLSNEHPYKETMTEIAKIARHLPAKFRAWYW